MELEMEQELLARDEHESTLSFFVGAQRSEREK